MSGDKEELKNSNERFLDFIGGLNILKLSKEQAANPKNLLSFKSLKSYPNIDFSETIEEFIDSMLNTELVINSKRMSQVTESMKQAMMIGENAMLFQELKNQSKDTVISKDLDCTNENNLYVDSKRLMLTSKATRDFDIPTRGRVPVELFDVEEFMKIKENSSNETRDANLRMIIAGFAWEIQQLREKISQMKASDSSFLRGSTCMHKTEKSRFNRIANQQADSSKQEGDIFKLDSDNLDHKNLLTIGRTAEGHTNLLNHLAITNSNLFFAETVQECGDYKTADQKVGGVDPSTKLKKPPLDLISDELFELSVFFSSKSTRQEIASWEAKLFVKERKFEIIINKLLKYNIIVKPMDTLTPMN